MDRLGTRTLSDPAQRLMVGIWRLYLDPPGAEPGVTCTEEGFSFPDDLPQIDPVGYAKLVAYVHDPNNRADTAPGFPKRLKLWPLSAGLPNLDHSSSLPLCFRA